MDGKWVVIATAYEIEVEIIAALLESSGIEVRRVNEAFARLAHIAVGPLAEVKLLVKEEDEAKAKEILAVEIVDEE